LNLREDTESKDDSGEDINDDEESHDADVEGDSIYDESFVEGSISDHTDSEDQAEHTLINSPAPAPLPSNSFQHFFGYINHVVIGLIGMALQDVPYMKPGLKSYLRTTDSSRTSHLIVSMDQHKFNRHWMGRHGRFKNCYTTSTRGVH